ncbi:MAG: Mur ligase domain-containing protein, partial [Candidatus Omnitrophica bacterium]|nr:Mur ligase domain-containing protein [Candidatus Omnitrophota bacterium]
MKLEVLFQGIAIQEKINWESHRYIKKITSDSRSVESGDLFIACRGSRMDGHDFLGQAIHAGASVIVCETFPEFPIPHHVIAVRVKDCHACFAEILNRFYQYPHEKVKLIGVTGTNGKTTIAYLLHRLLREKTSAAYLGTLWYELPAHKIQSPNTTPGPETLI